MPSARDILSEFYDGSSFDASPIVAKIETVEVRQLRGFNGELREKIIISLEGHRRKVVLNRTTGDKLIEGWGDDYDEWPGRYIALSSVPMMIAGKKKMVIYGEPSAARLADEA